MSTHTYLNHTIEPAPDEAGRSRSRGRMALTIIYDSDPHPNRVLPHSHTFILTDEECIILALDLRSKVQEHYPGKG